MGTLVPKLCGADIELGNFVVGLDDGRNTAPEASRALLREIRGHPHRVWLVASAVRDSWRVGSEQDNASVDAYNPQDWGRKYLGSNGGCIYIDLDHLELCIPEVISAYDHVAAWHAMLRIVRRAQVAANAKLPPGQRIEVIVNNSDGKGDAFGSHLNFLVSRRSWEDIFSRRLHLLLYLAAYQASSIVFTGQGKVGAENGRPEVAYQLSQRADFFERLFGVQTTYDRPLVNTRDEPLCGPVGGGPTSMHSRLARLHSIFFDSTLCQVASLLKVGVTQLVLAMIEADQVGTVPLLDDPVAAVVEWSHDPSLTTRVRTTTGARLTAVEVQLGFLESAKKFVESGAAESIVPRAGEIVALWEDTLVKLEARDFKALAARLDWVLKLAVLERALARAPELTWRSPRIKQLDFLYASLDLERGIYWTYERAGLVERPVSKKTIERFTHAPPEDTRAWTRAMLLRAARPDEIDEVDWDRVTLRRWVSGLWYTRETIDLSNPLGDTRARNEALFNGTHTLGEIVAKLLKTRRTRSSDLRAASGECRSLGECKSLTATNGGGSHAAS